MFAQGLQKGAKFIKKIEFCIEKCVRLCYNVREKDSAGGDEKMGNRKFELNMCKGSVLKTVLLFSIPLILSSILQLLYNAADLVVVSRWAGSNAMAAVGATGSISSLLTNVFIGFSLGGSVAVARKFGARDVEGVHKAVHTSMLLGAIVGVFCGIIGVVFCRPLLVLMGTPEGEVLDGAALYMRIIFIGVPASMIYNFGAAILRAVGDTKRPLYILAATGLVNVLLNLILVIGFHMDVAGVAIGTIAANYLSAAAILFALMRSEGAYRLDIRSLKMYKDSFKEIMQIGLPAGIQSSFFALSNTVVQSAVNSFGAVTIAGSTAGGNIEGFVYVSMNAFYQATMTGVSQNYGAKEEKRINKFITIPLLCAVVAGIVLGGACVLFAKPLLGIYITDSAAAIEIGVIRLWATTAPYFLVGMMECLMGAIRGLGYSTIPAITSFLGTCGVRILWIMFMLPLYRTEMMLFLAWPVSWVFVIICHVITLAIVKPRAMKKLREQE